ncbi:MAG TPA: hypothetical protein VK578_19800 [Edaphobacter sp.]|nr:hypothetical protein [Edaphobacter sp.]
MKLKLSIAMVLMVAPALAQSRPSTGGIHMRPQMVHDHTPKARVHTPSLRSK